jgi:proline iminopeptidase
MSWDVYREMWGSDGEIVIDGNLKPVKYEDHLGTIAVPTLIIVGDHDECAPSLSQAIHDRIPVSTLVILQKSYHMIYVDQPGMFLRAVDDFLMGKTK